MESNQFEKYQEFTEKTIFNLSQKVTMLEKKLDMFTNLLEISKYINQYIKDPNLFNLINDMLVGVFGAEHSTIYIRMNNDFYEAVSQNIPEDRIEVEKKLILEHNQEEFILSVDHPLYEIKNAEVGIHSSLGVPVKVENRLIGFILIQHTEKNYFSKDHAIFLSLIGNHIGVAIENNFLYKQIRDSAFHDGLTDIFNKRYFFETLNMVANLTEQNYCIAIVDLDNFKRINDTYGHPMGDEVLKTVSKLIQKATRTNDIVARYGGDEIIIFFQNFTDHDKVFQRVEAIRNEVAQTVITYDETSISITVSIGVYIKQDEYMTLNDVIKKADEIMYLSKNSGKNRVTIGG
ncbi:MAG: diguanylate cyclase with sensor [Herbinix sp.]|jgi:diguanylate cyclase (GGDEF)-like protein|nr:diguanylate cyclase with sensor [Herbinix sp.]